MVKSASLIVLLVVLLSTIYVIANPECLQRPGDKGRCRSYFLRYTYDPKKGCYDFVYGGCEGNDNNFETKEECNQACNS